MSKKKEDTYQEVTASETPQNNLLPEMKEIRGSAVANTQAGLATTKAPSLSDLLAEQRKNIVKDKTDAIKMQKYYALTDALGALGKIGGTAIGGAIGGNVMDSAPIVGEYKESRGYLDAFERAKQANDRLRALDDKQFQLAMRDEDRSYQQQQAKLNRLHQMQMIDYQNRINRANADKDFERKKQLEDERLAKQQAHDKEMAELRNKFNESEIRLKNQYNQQSSANSRANIKFQHDLYNTVPIAFDNGTGIKVSKADYEGLQTFLIGKKFGNTTVSKDNFGAFLRQNPKIVSEYLSLFSTSGAEETPATPTSKTPTSKTEAGKESTANKASSVPTQGMKFNGLDAFRQWAESTPSNIVETEDNVQRGVSMEDFKNKFGSLKQ